MEDEWNSQLNPGDIVRHRQTNGRTNHEFSHLPIEMGPGTDWTREFVVVSHDQADYDNEGGRVILEGFTNRNNGWIRARFERVGPKVTIFTIGDMVRCTESPGSTIETGEELEVRDWVRTPTSEEARNRGGWLEFVGKGKRRYFADRFEIIKPKLPFAVGDFVVAVDPNSAEARMGNTNFVNDRYVQANRLMTVVSVEAGNREWSSYENVEAVVRLRYVDTGAMVYGSTQNWPSRLVTKVDKDWKPKIVPVDLSSLRPIHVGMNEPPYGSCCGAKILYGYYCLHMGGNYSILKDNNGNPRPGNIKITPEMFKAAIRNRLGEWMRSTGCVTSILATDQIAVYGPILEEIGFVCEKVYGNFNHGIDHKNALYAYYFEDHDHSELVEKKRSFG